MLQPMTELVRIGWKLYARGQSPFNAAMSYTVNNAIIGAFPDYEIDASKVFISRGPLTPAQNGAAIVVSGNLAFSWDDNSGINCAKPTDKALIAVLNFDKGLAVTISEGAERATGTQTIVLPADWAGDEVQAYLGFISDDRRNVANSVYLGSIDIN